MLKLTHVWLSLVLLLLGAQAAQAAIFLVTETYDTTDANPGNGVCADSFGRCTLRAAVQESNALAGADIVVLPAGTYTLSIPGNAEHAAASGDLDLLASITIRGQGADRTVIDAAGIDRAFEAINAGTSLIEDLTIENGVAGANTPGYFAVQAGGAIAAVGNTSTLTLRGVVLRNNQAMTGGGLYNVYSTVQIYNSTLHDNHATTGSGGGIAEGLASFTRLYNVTLSGNRAAVSGGGLQSSNNSPLLYNVTITGNVADSDANGSGDGGGLARGVTAATLVNSIVAGNSDLGGQAPDCSSSVTSNGYNIIGDATGCTVSPAAGDQIGSAVSPVDAKLLARAVAENGVPMHALDPASPAVNAANPTTPGSGGTACLDTDARGASRTRNTPCDIGAYELAVFGRSFTVNSSEDALDASPGDGQCETGSGNRICTLRAAIQETNALDGRDIINVPAGTYTLALAGSGEDLAASGDLDVTDALLLSGAGMDQTFIDGAGLDRVFHTLYAGRIEMQGLTIRNGSASGGNGGGILLANSGGLDLTEVRISGNSANYGAGLYATLWSWMNDRMVNITRCVFDANTATQHGGGYANFTFRASKITDTTFSGNVAQIGGGLFNSFMSNALLVNSTLSGNQAQTGGGIAMQYGSGLATLVNTTVSGNTATVAGAGIHVPVNDRVKLFSSTVSANRAIGSASGGGIFAAGTVHLGNTAIAGNLSDDGQTPDCAATLSSFGYNLIGNDAGCTVTALASDRVGSVLAPIDPRLEALATHGDVVAYHRPLHDSPLLDAANPAVPGSGGGSCEANDQRYVDRVVNAPCDIGAVEVRSADLAVTASTSAASVVPGGPIDYLVQVTNVGPDTATGVQLTLTPAAGSSFVSATGSGWSCSTNGNELACQGADLALGAVSDLSLSFVSALTSGAQTASISISSTSRDSNAGNDNVLIGHTGNAPPSLSGLTATEYAAGATELAIARNVVVADSDSTTLAYATVRFSAGFVADQDRLSVTTVPGLTASWDAVNGSMLLSGTLPLASYQSVLRSILYSNLSATPTGGARGIEFIVSDGVFASPAKSATITVATAATAPVTPLPAEPPPAEPPVSLPPGGGGSLISAPGGSDTGGVADVSSQTQQADVQVLEVEAEQTAQTEDTAEPEAEPMPEEIAQETFDEPLMREYASAAGNTYKAAAAGRPTAAASAAPVLPVALEVSSIASAEFWEEIASMRETMEASATDDAAKTREIMITTAQTASVFLFAGLTNWYLKGSALLASLFASLPLWSPFDPLPILALNKRMRRRSLRTQATAAALELRYSGGLTRLLDTAQQKLESR